MHKLRILTINVGKRNTFVEAAHAYKPTIGIYCLALDIGFDLGMREGIYPPLSLIHI